MRLLIDIGNTQVKYVFQVLEASTSLTDIVYQDYESFKAQLLKGAFSQVTEIVLANVHAIEIADVIQQWAVLNEVAFLQVHSSAEAFGVYSSYLKPESLGVDRWLVMIGARQLYPQQNILIIDAGTATTVDLLHAKGQHYGGWIMPGVQTMFNSLLSQTKKIIAKPSVIGSLALGKNSSNCVNNGCWAMTVGAIKEAIIQANNALVLDKVLITGGNSQQLIQLINENCQLEPKLVFYGLSCFRSNAR